MVDGTQMYHDSIRRIQELERLNAALVAEIDRMRPVVEAALTWGHNGAHRLPELAQALIVYEATTKIECVTTSHPSNPAITSIDSR